jgi:hypothetical protein
MKGKQMKQKRKSSGKGWVVRLSGAASDIVEGWAGLTGMSSTRIASSMIAAYQDGSFARVQSSLRSEADAQRVLRVAASKARALRAGKGVRYE